LISAAGMPSLEKHEGWGNRLVALQEAAKLGHGFPGPDWLDVLPETGNIGCIPIEKNADGGNAGFMVISSASTPVCTLCKYSNAIHFEPK
jgi:hypothetical protein